MPSKLSRRGVIAAGVGTALTPAARAFPEVWIRPDGPIPVVISSGNGNTVTNGGTETCVARAYRLITEGSDVLDALIAGVNIVELDPKDSSVGYGGLPNAEGVVQLDSCCMHGPKKWAGGVACLEGVRTPSLVAKSVMENTDHHLLVGSGAQKFARSMGFLIEDDLNSDYSRKAWIEWKRRIDPDHYLDPTKREGAGHESAMSMIRDGLIESEHYFGTINCNGINPKGELCGVTTTSGLAFKIPGRVGDSPILGAGLYVDNAVGAAGSTGRGEANLFGLCSFLVIEELRRGASAKDAGLAALKRVVENTSERRLLNAKGQPNFGLNFYVLDKRGNHAAVAFSGHSRYAVCDHNGPRFEDCSPLFES